MTCTGCGTPISEGHAHRFDSTDRKVVATFCDDCCPRCWSGRRELPK